MLIYGWKQYVQVLAVLRLMCGQCGNASEHVLRKFTTKFTLFWIPLFPINKKHTLFCTACEHEQKLAGAQAQELMATGGPGMPPPGMPAPAMAPPGMPGPAPMPGMPAAGPANHFGHGPHGQQPPPGYPVQQPYPAQRPYPPQGYPPPGYGQR